jgi:elongation factor P--beta-lysine ligase
MIEKNSLEFAYLLQLVFAIDERDDASVQEAFAELDSLEVPFSLQNEIIAWAETYGASRKDTTRVARELEDLLIDLGY